MSCGNCIVMPGEEECLCCREIDEVVSRTSSAGIEYKMDLKLFYLGCVGATVQTAYYSYTDSIIAKMQLNEL